MILIEAYCISLRILTHCSSLNPTPTHNETVQYIYQTSVLYIKLPGFPGSDASIWGVDLEAGRRLGMGGGLSFHSKSQYLIEQNGTCYHNLFNQQIQ
jgi:hypothetical protein